MDKKTIGLIGLILGIVFVIVAVFGDSLGLGQAPGFGWKQIVVLVAGVVCVGGGLFLRRESSESPS